MTNRCGIVFKAALQYCIASLEIESDASIRALDGDIEDFYCTVLYNDETHTFEQVIQTLTRIVGHSQKDAVDYVSSIDREGRAVVKCASFQDCIDLKQEIEQNTVRPSMTTKAAQLKVAVLHKRAVAYQQFALQLLAWYVAIFICLFRKYNYLFYSGSKSLSRDMPLFARYFVTLPLLTMATAL